MTAQTSIEEKLLLEPELGEVGCNGCNKGRV